MAQKNIWTDEEKDYVVSKYKKGHTFEDMANSGKIKRSAYAIELKLSNIIYDKMQNGYTYGELSDEFNKPEKDIIDMEKKIFEMKNKSNNQTPYTNDGGYVVNQSNSQFDFGDMHHINRTMHVVLNFYENIDRLNKLKQNKLIDEQFYNDLMKGINEFTFDKKKILDSLKLSNKSDKSEKSEKTEKTEKTDKTDKTDNTEKTEKKSSRYNKSEDNDDGVDDLPKKMKKRLI